MRAKPHDGADTPPREQQLVTRDERVGEVAAATTDRFGIADAQHARLTGRGVDDSEVGLMD